MPHRHHPRRACALITTAAAAAATLAPAAHATTYNLANQPLNVATAPYSADDLLNCSGVTFSSTPAGGALLAAVNLTGNDTVSTAGGLTLAGALLGASTLTKTGTGALTLSAPSPSFLGPFTLNSSGGTLRLGIESPLSNTAGPLTLGAGTTLDLNGFNSPGRPVTAAGGISIVNDNAAATSTLSSLPTGTLALTLGGAGALTLATPLQGATSYTKTGTGTLTLAAASPSFSGYFTVSSGILALGAAAPLSPPASLSISSGASLDLNGFSSAGASTYLSTGASLVNNNTSSPSTLASLAPFTFSGTPTLGGAGDINLTTKLTTSLTKAGTGTLSLSAANTSFAGTLTLNDGTLRLNNPSATGPSATFNLNGTSNTSGALDLNGYPAPVGIYNFNGGLLVNDNTASPSTVDFSAIHTTGTPLMFGGAGDMTLTGLPNANFYRFGPGTGTLTLNNATPQSLTAYVYAGTLRLGNPAPGAYNGTVTIAGSSAQFPYRASVIDLNGRTSLPLGVTLFNNGGFVNNNTSTPATLDSATLVNIPDVGPAAANLTLGGDGTLILTSDQFPSTLAIDKVGAGLLTLPSFYASRGVNLRAGTLQAEADNQLGAARGPISFLGGTLRIAPLYLPPATSYTFTSPVTLNPTPGNTLDTRRDSTFTGLLTGSGPLTKTGTASATLNPDPSSRLDLTLQSGTLRLSPSSHTAPTLTSLSFAPGTSLDLTTPSLILDIHVFTTSPLSLVRGYLHGNAITTPSADATHRLAYAQASDLPADRRSTPTWTLPDDTAVLVTLTLAGDANLDGQVDADDYALLDRTAARTLANPRYNAHWTDGDFNYDGTVDQNDYLLIDTTYLSTHPASAPTLLAERQSQFGPTYVQALLTSVPEPSSLLLLTTGYWLLATSPRRRRRPQPT